MTASTAWKKTAEQKSAPGHAWQTTPEKRALVGARPARWRRRLGVTLYATIFAAVAGLLLYELVLVPYKTPVIAAVAIDYHWPLLPNAWAREDIEGLKNALGDQTLAVHDLPLASISSGEAVSAIAAQIEQSAASRGGAVVVYLSAQGAVDGRGEPCLLLPSSDPVDSGTWLRVSDLLARIKALSSRREMHCLLLMDCNRQDENWSVGLLQNTFTERLAEAVGKAAVPRLSVINSCAEGQIAWSSPQLQGSVFGHFLRIGLAGAADTNGDGRVSLHELQVYLKGQVEAWSRNYRGVMQSPTLMPADAEDFPVAWSLSKKSQRDMAAAASKPDTRAAIAAAGKLADLWRQDEKLKALHPEHYAALQWQHWEHELIWLEHAAMAGGAYKPIFDRSLEQVSNPFRAARQLAQNASAGTSAPVRMAAALAGDDALPVGDIKAYSQAVADYLGNAVVSPRGDAAVARSNYAENHLARLFEHYGANALWPDSSLPQDVLALQTLAQHESVPHASAALAADLRAHALVRPLLDRDDQVRRRIEDGVYLGADTSPGLAKEVDECKKKYSDIDETQKVFARAYQARDRAWSELPSLTVWLDGESEPVDAVLEAHGKLKDRLIALIDAVGLLDQSLQEAERASHDAGEVRARLAAAAQHAAAHSRDVNDEVDQLGDHLLREARRLPLAAATPATVLAMARLLESPLVSGGDRAELLRRYIELTVEIDSKPVTAATPVVVKDAAAKSNAASDKNRADVPSAGRWTIHPATALLDMPPGMGTGRGRISGNLDQLGERLRVGLRKVALGSTSDNSDDAAPEVGSRQRTVGGNAPPTTSGDVFDVDRPFRRLVALEAFGANDAAARLRRRHLQELLLWQAQRSLDDFWGSFELGANGAAGQEPYFATAAKGYLNDVRLLASPDLDVERRMQAMAMLIDARSAAAAQGLVVTATDLVLINAESSASALVSVRGTASAAGLPSGRAAVYLRDQVTPISQTLHELDLSPGLADGPGNSPERTKQVTVTVPGRELVNRTTALQAVTMFRGHEFPAPLAQRKVAGRIIDVSRQKYATSRITLRGERLKRAAVVFILDCSHSMSDTIEVESPESTARGSRRTKLGIAIDALDAMLERLGEQGDTRVGVRFFGHRVGWRTDQVNSLARQEAYPGGVPTTLRPYEDVELFLPLGRFDSVTAGNVAERLKTLKPWGESPIYLSLQEALKDFAADDAQGEQRVVVITDGMNNQFNPPPESAPTLADVEKAYASKEIAVDIVGFGIPEGEKETAARDFTHLADTTRGSFNQASNASALTRRLEQLLVKTHFQVANEAGRVLEDSVLGGTVNIRLEGPQTSAPPRSSSLAPQASSLVTIEVDKIRADAVLEGGEALQLAIRRAGNRIISLPYEENSPIFVPLLTPEPLSPTGYRVGLHRPNRESDAVTFPVSFQRVDQGIPRRPAQVWLEIAPVAQGRVAENDGFIFYDEIYESELPAPVMRCRARDWPKEADQAQVRVWCAPEPIAAEETVPLLQVANKNPDVGQGFEMHCVGGISYQVRTSPNSNGDGSTEIRVVERHSPGVAIDAVKVEVFPSPRRMIHEFDAEHGVVLHTFICPATDPDHCELRFTSRSHFMAAAWQIEQPITIGIPRHNEVVLPPRIIDPNGATK